MVKILILTEDAAKDASDCVKHLVRSACKLAVSNTQTHKLTIGPTLDGEVIAAMKANLWRTKQSHRKELVSLMQEIAAEIAAGGFVIFHYDGDCSWSERDEKKHLEFQEKVIARVKILLQKKANEHLVDQHNSSPLSPTIQSRAGPTKTRKKRSASATNVTMAGAFRPSKTGKPTEPSSTKSQNPKNKPS